MKSLRSKISIMALVLSVSLLWGCSSNADVSVNKDTSVNSSIKKNPKSTDINKTDEVTEYLKANYSPINTEKLDDFSDLTLIDNDLKNKEVFFTAENHGVKANSELKMKFLKYFKEKTDFKYFLCETSYSDAYFYNKFLESGDIKILEEMYKPLKGTFAWNKDGYNQWKELYQINKTLPDDRKIQVVGVDLEHQPINAFRYMYTVLPAKESPEEIAEILNEFEDIWNQKKKVNESELKDFCKRLKNNIEDNKNIYKEFLGENFFGFNLVIDNILYRFEAYEARGNSFNQVRDKRMYENFKKVYETLPSGKYYGQWGLNHAFQKEQNSVKWIAATMNDECSSLKDKILTIAYVYDNCKYMSKTGNNTYAEDKIDIFNRKLDNINTFIEDDYNLFKLTGENSPFKNQLIWPFYNIGSEPKEGVTTDFFQYFVLIKNSKATEPLNDQYE